MKTNKLVIGLAAGVAVLSGCLKNKKVEFPDYDYQTVYFATQYPLRTLMLGEDEYVDNSLDKEHKVSIKATTGGVRDNKKELLLDFIVDPSYTNNAYFPSDRGNAKITPLPASHYQLASNQITIPAGSILGGAEIKLTDAFFQDPLSITNTYVLPLKLTGVKGGDSILSGLPGVANPNPLIDANWAVKPKDFVVYAIKFINAWHGNYLRRGKDEITGSVTQNITRHAEFVERDEVKKLSTKAYKVVDFPITYKDAANNNVNVTLQITFDDNGNCTVGSNVANVTATGTGKFVSKGEKQSWGGKDRDALYLSYNVSIADKNLQIKATDTLVMRDRAVVLETYTPVIR